MTDCLDEIVQKAAKAMEEKGERSTLMRGALDLDYGTYEVLARVALEAVAHNIGAVALRKVAESANSGPALPDGAGDWLDGAVDVIDFIVTSADQLEKRDG